MTGHERNRSDRLERWSRAIGIANINLSLQTNGHPIEESNLSRASLANDGRKTFSLEDVISA